MIGQTARSNSMHVTLLSTQMTAQQSDISKRAANSNKTFLPGTAKQTFVALSHFSGVSSRLARVLVIFLIRPLSKAQTGRRIFCATTADYFLQIFRKDYVSKIKVPLDNFIKVVFLCFQVYTGSKFVGF